MTPSLVPCDQIKKVKYYNSFIIVNLNVTFRQKSYSAPNGYHFADKYFFFTDDNTVDSAEAQTN